MILKDITSAADFIKSGRIVAFPTGTSYGLAADATQGWALQRLRNMKNRNQQKTFTVLCSESIRSEYFDMSEDEEVLLNTFAGQPLTLLVKPKEKLTHLASNERVGLRLIDHPLMQQLAEAAAVPLTATSANRGGEAPCYNPEQVEKVFNNPLPNNELHESKPRGASGTTYDLSLAAILDGGHLPKASATTIAKVESKHPVVVRQGNITEDDLRSALKTT